MTKNFVLLCVGLISLSSCNMFSGIDSPSGDEQLLSAARGAFDRGDYDQATEYYQQLSGSMADVRISETSLMEMAQAGIFSVQDLVASMGSNRGGGNSFVILANTMANNQKTAASYRTQLDQLYVNAGTIVDVKLKAYTRFLIALAMTNQILSSAVGGDGVLTESDIVSNGPNCRANSIPDCQYPGFPGTATTAMTDTSTPAAPTSWVGSAVDTAWSATASVDMLIVAATAANDNFATLTGSAGSGITQALNQIKGYGALGAPARRQGLLQTMFPH